MKAIPIVIASDRAFRGRARQSHLYEKNHPSTALRVTLDEIAVPTFGGFAMTAPGVYLGSDSRCEPPGHNFANREIKTQRNKLLRCGDRVFKLGHRSNTLRFYPRDLKITRAQKLRNMIGKKIKAF